MSLRSTVLTPFALAISRKIAKDARNAVKDQTKTLKYLVSKARNTQFGRDHHFREVKDIRTYQSHVPLRDYEGHRPYVEQILEGKPNMLWPGMPKYFAKTSGTTSGVKYIPISADSMPFHIQSARNATFNMLSQLGRLDTFDGKLIFLSGSPTLTTPECGVLTGRLSGIVNHEIPSWLTKSQLPTYSTNCIDDWETKLDRIVEETRYEDMRLISGIPPWVQMYYEKLLEATGKTTVSDLFPNFNIFVYGGVNFQPYRESLTNLVGRDVPSLETYPASEGFIAFQDRVGSNDLLLNSNAGIFYEFVPLDQVFDESPDRVTLADVEIGKDYAIILTTNAGLWAYNIGDTVRFVSKDPYRLVVSGRIKHYISAFGEHVIGKEVDQAMTEICQQYSASVVEYTVAPQVNPTNGEPYHEWFVEWEKAPVDMQQFRDALDKSMQIQNIYYKDLIVGKVLKQLQITSLSTGSFRRYMESKGKLGGQNKVPRLSNDRSIVSQLT